MIDKKYLSHDEWLSKILGRETYRIIVDQDFLNESKSIISKQIREIHKLQSRRVFMYAKVSSSFIPGIKFLEMMGFNLVDNNIIFEKPIASSHIFGCESVVRNAVSQDRNRVVDIARRNFAFSRFHLDPDIPNSIANRIKAEWVKSYFSGKRGNEVIVAEIKGKIAGFLLIMYDQNKDLIIDLIATDKNQRGKGLASKMIAYAESKSDGANIQVGTQVVNIPSINFYLKNGFRIRESNYVFHFHNFGKSN